MPCRDYQEEDSKETIARKHKQNDIAKLQKRKDELAVLLCEACNTIEDNGLKEKMSEELKDWHWKHSKEDKKRGK